MNKLLIETYENNYFAVDMADFETEKQAEEYVNTVVGSVIDQRFAAILARPCFIEYHIDKNKSVITIIGTRLMTINIKDVKHFIIEEV